MNIFAKLILIRRLRRDMYRLDPAELEEADFSRAGTTARLAGEATPSRICDDRAPQPAQSPAPRLDGHRRKGDEGGDPHDLVRLTPEGIPIKPLYTEADLAWFRDRVGPTMRRLGYEI